MRLGKEKRVRKIGRDHKREPGTKATRLSSPGHRADAPRRAMAAVISSIDTLLAVCWIRISKAGHRLLLADEPTNDLDALAEQEIVRILAHLKATGNGTCSSEPTPTPSISAILG